MKRAPSPVSTTEQRTPEANLVLAILLQAVEDARHGDADAWAFLTDPSGTWARARNDLCWCLGVDPADLRRWVLSQIKPPRVRPRADTAYPVADRALAVLAAESPLRVREIAFRAGCTVEVLSSELSVLRKRGMVEPVSKGIWRLVPNSPAAVPQPSIEPAQVRAA